MENKNNEERYEFSKETNLYKAIVEIKTMLEGISTNIYSNGGKCTIDTLEKTTVLLSELTVKKKFLKDELVLNINTVKERFEKDMIFDSLNITIMTAMLDQLKLGEGKKQ
jgi:hypothetical protein